MAEFESFINGFCTALVITVVALIIVGHGCYRAGYRDAEKKIRGY